jgi:hypothetical protein
MITIINNAGAMLTYKNNRLHNDGDEPAIIFADGSKHYYKEGKLHRDGDMPAGVYVNGDTYYYLNGNRHRYDGPAVILADGTEIYYWHGSKVSKSKLMFLCRAKRKQEKLLKKAS